MSHVKGDINARESIMLIAMCYACGQILNDVAISTSCL